MRRHLFGAGVVLGGLAIGFATPSAADDRASCFTRGATDSDIAACTRLIASDSLSATDRARVHLRRGFLYARRAKADDFDRAVADANELRRQDPSNGFAFILRATGYIRKGTLDRAYADLIEGRRLIPADSAVSNAFGNYYFAKQEYDRALVEFDEAVRMNAENFFAIRTRGLVYEKKGDFQKALADLRTALRADPQRSENLGREAAEAIARIERLIAAQGTTPAVNSSRSPTSETVEVLVNGQRRTYLLSSPGGPRPHPAVIFLHGAGGNAARLAQTSGLQRIGPEQGFVAVFPEGLGARWNYFPPGKEPPSYRQAFQNVGGIPDDALFLRTLIADLVRNGAADPKRIYLAGISAGGIMALRFVCADASSVAAIAVFIGAMPDSVGADCRPPRPLPVLMLSGTADPYLPFVGGPIKSADPRLRSDEMGSVWSMERLAEFLRQHNGCGSVDYSIFAAEPERIEISRSQHCLGGPVVVYRVVGGGHRVPESINAGRLVLDFFRDQAR